MRPLTSTEVMDLWEHGATLHPIDRVLAALSLASSVGETNALASLPIGERVRAAIALRSAMFGRAWSGEARCPHCGERHEVEPPVDAILHAGCATRGNVELVLGDYGVVLRLPTSRDQAAVASCGSVESAVGALLERCVCSCTRLGAPIATQELPGEIVDQLAQRLAELDPGAEILLELRCVSCSSPFQLVFDAGDFLWSELSSHAQRLLYQVHVLARSYGWSEAEVLHISEPRRAAYLALVGA